MEPRDYTRLTQMIKVNNVKYYQIPSGSQFSNPERKNNTSVGKIG